MKRFTIGVTTFNESENIQKLLDALANINTGAVDIILYDDCSTDQTKDIILNHPIIRQENFKAEFAVENSRTPSVGRTFIGQNSKTEYTVLLDGDDQIDVENFLAFVEVAPSGYDLILSPIYLRGAIVPLAGETGPIDVDNNTIRRLLSSIGGKAYRTNLLRKFGPDPVRGRSDDVRLNMRILSSKKRKLYQITNLPFYIVEESRKSFRVATINFDEVEERCQKYEALQQMYPIDRRYLSALKRNLRKVILEDEAVPASEKARLLSRVDTIFKFALKRIIFIGGDISGIGGIPERLKKVQRCSFGRSVDYFLFGISGASGIRNSFSVDTDAEAIKALLSQWDSSDTVFVTANNLLKKFPPPIRKRITKFPIIYMCSGQMSFIVQNTIALSDLKYVQDFKASRIISFSDADISFQRQLGIYGQVKGFLGVETREINSFNPQVNKYLGYVGRIDFHTKDCGKLIDIAISAKEIGLPPIKIFTTNADNSPDFANFIKRAEDAAVLDQLDITLECTDRDEIYRQIGMLLLPSKKESFGNVILEAYSYGIPVIGRSYVPGPSELIEHARTGYLLDEYTGTEVVEIVKNISAPVLMSMSKNAFEKHKSFSMESHLDFMERVASEVLQTFSGKNHLQVFPELKVVSNQRIIPNKERKVVVKPSKTTTPERAKKMLYAHLKQYSLARKVNKLVKRLATF